uniref:Uncharacterized protein n=1 Tax=Trichuris muris TaxID=70415 RepID=A0A5S6QB85_TRIMR
MNDSKTSSPYCRSVDVASLKVHLFRVDESIREAAASFEAGILKKELQKRNKYIRDLESELRVLKDVEQKAHWTSASLQALTLEEKEVAKENSNKMMELQIAEQRWRTISEQYKEMMNTQRSEAVDLRTKYEELLRSEVSLRVKYEILEAEFERHKSISWTRAAEDAHQPTSHRHLCQNVDACCYATSCLSSAITGMKSELTPIGNGFRPAGPQVNNSCSGTSSLNNRTKQYNHVAMEDVCLVGDERLITLDNWESSKQLSSAPNTASNMRKARNACGAYRSMGKVIAARAQVELALPRMLAPIRKVKWIGLPVEPAKKKSKCAPMEDIGVDLLLPRKLSALRNVKRFAPAGIIPCTGSTVPQKEREEASEVYSPPALGASRTLVPVDSSGKNGKPAEDTFLQKQRRTERSINLSSPIGACDQHLPTVRNEGPTKVSTSKPTLTISAESDTDMSSSTEKQQPSNVDVMTKLKEGLQECDVAPESDGEMNDRLVICCEEMSVQAETTDRSDRLVIFCDEPFEEMSVQPETTDRTDGPQSTDTNDSTFSWAFKFEGSFPVHIAQRCALLPSAVRSEVRIFVERDLVGLFNMTALLNPAIVCDRLNSLGEKLTPQTLSNSIIAVLSHRNLPSVSICRKVNIIPFQPVMVKGERCIVTVLQQIFEKRPSKWARTVKRRLLKQLLSTLIRCRLLTASQIETFCRFYVLFAEKVQSRNAVCRLIVAAASVAIERKAELALSVLMSWPKIFQEIFCDKKKLSFVRVVLTGLVRSANLVHGSVLKELIDKLCGEKITTSTCEEEALFTMLSQSVLLHGAVEISSDTGDVRLKIEWARKVYVMKLLLKLNDRPSLVTCLKQNFLFDLMTWPPQTDDLSSRSSALRRVVISVLVLGHLADPKGAFSQLDVKKIVGAAEGILQEEWPVPEKPMLASCCSQLLVRLLPWYPTKCFDILQSQCNALSLDAQWRHHFEMAKNIYSRRTRRAK